MSDRGGQVQTTTNQPWEGQRPHLTGGYEAASNLLEEQGRPTYFPGQTYAGLGANTNTALGNAWNYSTSAPGRRAGSQYALDQFAGGGLGDWGTVGALRNLGATNDNLRSPANQNLSGMAQHGSGLGADYVARNSDILETGGNIGDFTGSRLGDISSTGGNVAGFSDARIGDITATGAGSNDQIRADINDLITGEAQANNPAYQQLGATAAGAYLNSNPYLDATFQRAADKLGNTYQTVTAPSIDMDAAAGGRYGSGLHASRQAAGTGALGDALSGLATQVYGGNYATERQNQIGAANSLGGQYLQGQQLRASTAATSADQAARDAALRLQATGQISGDMSGDLSRRVAATQAIAGDMSGDLSRRMAAGQTLLGAQQQDVSNLLDANRQLGSAYDAGANRQINALNSASNAYLQNRGQQLQGLGMVPEFQDMDYRDLQAQMGIGSTYDADAQARINDAVNRYNFNQNAPWQQLQQYMSIIGGGSPGSVSSTTTSGNGGWLSGLGGLASILGGAGQFATGTRGLLWG